MPTPGVNVLQNADFSSGLDYWIGDRTWDPLLSWGVFGQTSSLVDQNPPGLIADGVIRLDFGASTQLDPVTGYGGLNYAGGGFDAEPGDTWRVKFTATRRSFLAPYHGAFVDSLGQGDDLFIRFGLCIQDGSGDWISYYKNLPAGATSLDGGVISYDETFEVPSNWPAGTYQFAVCHTGSNALPVQNAFNDYLYGFSVELTAPWLEFVSNGGGSPGPAGVANPYASWPTPRWAPGSPTSHVIIGGGGCCCGVVEWDQFDFRAPMVNGRAVIALLDHVPTRTFRNQGWAGTWLCAVNEVSNAFLQSRAGSCVTCYTADDDGNPATQVPTAQFGGGPYDGTQVGWVGCGDFCMYLMAYYVAVEGRENLYATLPITHFEEWFSIPAFVPTIVHPSTVHWPNPGNGIIFGVLDPETQPCGEEDGGPEGNPGIAIVPADHDLLFCSHTDCDTVPIPPPGPGSTPQSLYLTHEVAPGDDYIPAGGTGGLSLRGIRAAPGDANAPATGSPGLDLGHIKGQP